MMGALIKRLIAQRLNVAPDQIVNVSIMPCVAKKDEIARPQLTLEMTDKDGKKKVIPETDYVLTTREIGHLIEKERVSRYRIIMKRFTYLATRSRSRRFQKQTSIIPSARQQVLQHCSELRAVFSKQPFAQRTR
jgi:iron only hydrogenase large subunit-like protein